MQKSAWVREAAMARKTLFSIRRVKIAFGVEEKKRHIFGRSLLLNDIENSSMRTTPTGFCHMVEKCGLSIMQKKRSNIYFFRNCVSFPW